MTQDEINQAEWSSPDNWLGGALGVYRSARDTRVWVPKRVPGMGWTLNFARRASWAWLLATLVIPVLLLLLLTGKATRRAASDRPLVAPSSAVGTSCFITDRSVLARAPGTPAPGPADLHGTIRLDSFPSGERGEARLQDSDGSMLGASWRRQTPDSIVVTGFDDFLRVEMRLSNRGGSLAGIATALSDATQERDSTGAMRDFARRWEVFAREAPCS